MVDTALGAYTVMEQISNLKKLFYISMKFKSFVLYYVKFINRHSWKKLNVRRKIFQTIKIEFGEILGPVILFPNSKFCATGICIDSTRRLSHPHC